MPKMTKLVMRVIVVIAPPHHRKIVSLRPMMRNYQEVGVTAVPAVEIRESKTLARCIEVSKRVVVVVVVVV